MFVTRNVPTDHKDLIHDVAYDFYGRRFATCSSDQSVKVWDLGEDEQWRCTASWKTHSGSVWRVTWAHPEFGQIIATCSFDRSVGIWEELISDGQNGERNQSTWIRKALLVDHRASVTDVKFSPKHLGLVLASCSADGYIRIYECADIMNLGQWTLQHDISTKLVCSSLSWNPSPFHPAMIAVGSNEAASPSGKVQIYELSENSRRWVKVETLTTITEPVNDLSFAPNVGRSSHLLAIGSKDVRILSLKTHQDQADLSMSQLSQTIQNTSANGSTGNAAQSKYDIRQLAQFDDHNSQVWRVTWNVTGTILASSGDDGNIRLWKPNYLSSWKSIAVIKGDGNATLTIQAPLALRGVSDVGDRGIDGALNRQQFKNNSQQTSWR